MHFLVGHIKTILLTLEKNRILKCVISKYPRAKRAKWVLRNYQENILFFHHLCETNVGFLRIFTHCVVIAPEV